MILLFLVYAMISPCVWAHYTLDGVGNNEEHPQWGAAKTAYIRSVKGAPTLGLEESPSPRDVSNMLFQHRDTFDDPPDVSGYAPTWGALLVHDMIASSGNGSHPLSTPVPTCDQWLDVKCAGLSIDFTRSKSEYDATGPTAINHISAFLDGTVLYGESEDHAMAMRTFKNGKLNLTKDDVFYFPIPDDKLSYVANKQTADPAKDGIFTGDRRGLVQPTIIPLLLVFNREHNARCDQILAKYPTLSDQEVYEQARRWVIALVQHITFHEYLPVLIGGPMPKYVGYDPTVDPGIDVFFATVSARYGHSALSNTYERVNEEWRLADNPPWLLRDLFFNGAPFATSRGCDEILRSLVFRVEASVDADIVTDMRNFLFNDLFDIVSVNIARGRERGVTSYNDAREHFGLPRMESFANISDDEYVQQTLESLYGTVDRIDPFVGSLAEAPKHRKGSLGPLMARSWVDQFNRTQHGDRFWFQRPGVLTAEDLAAVKDTTLRDVIARNSGVEDFPPSAFAGVSTRNTPGVSGAATQAGGNTFSPMAGYDVIWTIEDETHVQLTLESSDAGGFVGIGFGESPMTGVDIIICRVNDGLPTCEDSYSEYFAPTPDASQNIVVSHASIENGITTVTFKRPLDTGEANDYVITDTDIPVFFARNPTAPDSYHGLQNRVSAQINFFTGAIKAASVEIDSVRLFHGSVMITMWSLIYPAGAYLARYQRHRQQWLVWHVRLQSSGVVGALTFMLVAVTSVGEHLTVLHHAVGFALFSGLVVQFFLGHGLRLMIKRSTNLDMRKTVRVIHASLGLAMVSVAFYNCWLGINRMFETNTTVTAVYFFYVGLIAAVFGVAEYRLRVQRSRPKVEMTREVPLISRAKMQEHVTSGKSNFVIIQGVVVDTTELHTFHPGGVQILDLLNGQDITTFFMGTAVHGHQHAHSADAWQWVERLAVYRIENYALPFSATLHKRETHIEKDGKRRRQVLHIFLEVLNKEGTQVQIEAGQHMAFKLINKDGTKLERFYSPISVASTADSTHCLMEFYIKVYEDGAFTPLLAELRLGSAIQLEGPIASPLKNPKSPDGVWPRLLCITGGTGITPALPLIRNAVKHRQENGDLGVSPVLVYANEDAASAIAGEELREYARDGHLHLVEVFSHGEDTENAERSAHVKYGKIDGNIVHDAVQHALQRVQAEDQGSNKTLLASVNNTMTEMTGTALIPWSATDSDIEESSAEPYLWGDSLTSEQEGSTSSDIASVFVQSTYARIVHKYSIRITLEDWRVVIVGPSEFTDLAHSIVYAMGAPADFTTVL